VQREGFPRDRQKIQASSILHTLKSLIDIVKFVVGKYVQSIMLPVDLRTFPSGVTAYLFAENSHNVSKVG
jgi:hypothetical protein